MEKQMSTKSFEDHGATSRRNVKDTSWPPLMMGENELACALVLTPAVGQLMTQKRQTLVVITSSLDDPVC
jgi:hypothetical protein